MVSNNMFLGTAVIEFIFAAILGIFVIGIGAQTDSADKKLEQHYYDKCLRETGDGASFEKLRTDVYEMLKYFELTSQELPNERRQFCSEARKNLKSRIDAIANDLDQCLPRQEKFFSTFIRASFKEFLHFLCHNDAEYMKRFFSADGNQCRKKMESQVASNNIENCFGRIFAPTGTITKKDICDDLGVAKKCFAQSLDVHCPDSYNYKELNTIFFNYISKPCSGCGTYYFSIMLIMFCGILHIFIK